MASQIRPTRLDVTDRFPMLGFTIVTDGPPRIGEVVIASDIALFTNPEGRTPSTFYSSREHGPLTLPKREAVYVVPPDVLARFIAADRLWFALATASPPAGNDWTVDVLPTESSPYVSLAGLSDRALRRVRMFPTRGAAGGYGGGRRQGVVDWAGDKARPGSAPVSAPVEPSPRTAPADSAPPAPTATDVPYDDGFGPLPPLNTAPATEPRTPATPVAQSYGSARGFDADPDDRGVGAPIFEDLDGPQAMAFGNAPRTLDAAEYDGVTKVMASPNYSKGRGGQTIDRIVIHITGAPQSKWLGSWFVNPESNASSHYMVDQNGEIIQFVREEDTAWHAGVGSQNRRSIGIEHVAIQKGGANYKRKDGSNQHFPYTPPTDVEYRTSATMVAHLCHKYGLTPDRTTIIGHREADPNTTHSACPDGAWDWDGYMTLVAECHAAAAPATTQGYAMGREAKSYAARPSAHALGGGDTVEIKYRTFIPSPAIKGPPLMPDYHGDGRGFSHAGGTSRGEITFLVDLTDGGALANLRITDRHWGTTHAYDSSDTHAVEGKPDWWLGLNSGAQPTSSDTVAVSDDNLRAYIGAPGTTRNVLAVAELASIVSIYACGANPLIPGSPAIDADLSVLLRRSAGGIEAKVFGSHDGFPAHEVYVNGQRVHHYDPVAAGNGPSALMPPEDRDVDTSWATVPSASAGSLAHAMVAGADDRRKIKEKNAHEWKDLFQWNFQTHARREVVDGLAARGFTDQKLQDAAGDLNLDFYKVEIVRFPPGLDAPKLLDTFIRNINDFVDSDICNFKPYDDSDAARLKSGNPLGAVLNLDINAGAFFFDPRGWDDAAIVISDVQPQFYAVTTIETPDTGQHPVSGNRQFGWYTEGGRTYFYVRGADRATSAPPGIQNMVFAGGEALWESFQRVLANYIMLRGGEAKILPPFSERFNSTAIRDAFGQYSSSQGLAPQLGFAMAGDERARAAALGAPGGLVEIKYRAFIPSPIIKGPASEYDPGRIGLPNAIGGEDFGGDGRDFSYASGTSRAELVATLQLNSDGSSTALKTVSRHWGESKAYDSSYTYHVAGKPDWWLDRHAGLKPVRSSTLAVSDGNLRILDGSSTTEGYAVAVANRATVVTVEVEGALPLVWPSADIDANLGIFLKPAPGGVQVMVIGSHDGFPAHELYVNGHPVHTYDPVAAGKGPGKLLGSGDEEVKTDWILVPWPASGTSQSLAAAMPRALDADDWSVNWDEVYLVPQPTNLSCWATAAAMVDGWKRRQSISIDHIAQFDALGPTKGLPWVDHERFAGAVGFTIQRNACYLPEGFRDLIEANGPLWVSVVTPFPSGPSGHAVIVTGMYRENGKHFVRITDPWDRIVGTPGAPGPRTSTHATGSRYIMSWEAFAQEYESTGGMADFAQLLHTGGTHGHSINRGNAADAGYALALNAPADAPAPGEAAKAAPVARNGADDLGVGTSLTRRTETAAGRSYDLAQLAGIVAPANAPAGGAGAPSLAGERAVLTAWPYIEEAGNKTQAGLVIDWRHQGGGVGDVMIAPEGGQVFNGWSAAVKADIGLEASTANQVNLKVRVKTTFSRAGETDQVAITDVVLKGDGSKPVILYGADQAAPALPATGAPPGAMDKTPADQPQLEKV